MARAPVLSSDKAADGAPKEVVDAANKLVDEIIQEAEATVARNNVRIKMIICYFHSLSKSTS